jgi:hypothetical protein
VASGDSLACLYIPQFTLRAFFPQVTDASAVAEPMGVITEVSAAAWRQGVRQDSGCVSAGALRD